MQQTSKAVWPCSSYWFTSTPQPIKNLTTSARPFLQAKCKGVANAALTRSGFEPVLSINNISIFVSPRLAAL
jgi:hypothetical protein